MKILFLAESFPTSIGADLTGGVEAGDWYTATYLAKNHEVHVVTAARIGSPQLQKMKGMTVHRVGNLVTSSGRESISSRLAFVRGCLSYIPAISFDLLHASNTFTQWIALQLAERINQPMVARIADVYMGSWVRNTNFLTGVAGEVMERSVLAGSWSGVISWSEATRQKLLLHGVSDERIQVIHGGIDLETIQRAHVIKKKIPTICTVGRLVTYKHIDCVIQAISLLKKRYPQLRLEIIGDGPARKQLEHLAENLGLQSKVIFLGSITLHAHVLKHVKTDTLFCLPSTVEGFGLATLEACASGTPYIAIDIPATREITHGGEGGFLLKSPDSVELADRVDALLSDTTLYNTKVRESQRLAKIYDWSKSAHQTEKYFKKVLK